jgi:hypothetical protein
MSTEFERLLRDNENPPTTQCMLTNVHNAHDWWYTSWGGGHMLSYISEEDLRLEKGLKKHHCDGLTEAIPKPAPVVPEVKDFDFGAAGARSGALHTLRVAFSQDPVLGMLDDRHQLRLAKTVIDRLIDDEATVNMYRAANHSEYNAVPDSIYNVFGRPLAYRVAVCVQQSLYPKSYAEAT